MGRKTKNGRRKRQSNKKLGKLYEKSEYVINVLLSSNPFFFIQFNIIIYIRVKQIRNVKSFVKLYIKRTHKVIRNDTTYYNYVGKNVYSNRLYTHVSLVDI